MGQNQKISAIATGIEPQTTAQGVKIDPMNSTVVNRAETSGQMVGAGEGSRMSGSASITVVRSVSRSSTFRPLATGREPWASHNGEWLETIGICAKL